MIAAKRFFLTIDGYYGHFKSLSKRKKTSGSRADNLELSEADAYMSIYIS